MAAVDGSYDRILCLGDVVGYGGDPNACVQWVREHCPAGAIVRGNHDKVCCGLESGEDFNATALKAANWTTNELTQENLDYLRSLPEGPLTVSDPTLSFQIVHGSPLDEDEYLVNASDAGMAFEHQDPALTFFGHTHVQGGFVANPPQKEWWGHGSGAKVIRMKNGPGIATNTMLLDDREKYLLNPGSIGQPRDADNRAGVCIYESQMLHLDYWRIPYDIAAAQARIRRANLPEVLATRLQYGR